MNGTDGEVHKHLQTLRDLQTESGLFLASKRGISTGYDKAWLRDNFYITLAFERAGEWNTVKKTWRAVLDIFVKHTDKINWAIEHKPYETWQYIHARYNPETFEEYWEEWGNKQNDTIGAMLFKLCECNAAGVEIIETDEDRAIVQKLVDYLNSIEYWHDRDNGVWEEQEEVHSSSIGPCVAALKALAGHSFVEIPDGLIERGEEALEKLLPRESESKFVDLAQLSLIYPYRLLNREMADEILEKIEYYYLRDNGVIRYKNDVYYNNNEDDWSEEAEWTMGLPWLSIIYSQRDDLERARIYIEQARAVMTERGMLPELYYANSKWYNENTPLGWAESMFVVALYEFAAAEKRAEK